MDVRDLKLSSVSTKKNYRSTYEEDDMSMLMNSIRDQGLINPPTVLQTEKGYKLIAGFRRYFALKKLGYKKAPFVVRYSTEIKNDLDAEVFNISENLQRREISLFDLGLAAKDVMSKHKLNMAEFSARVNYPAPKIKLALETVKHIPARYSKDIHWGTGRAQGKITLTSVRMIINAQKHGSIRKPQVAQLLDDAKRNGGLDSAKFKAMIREVKNGKTVKQGRKAADKLSAVNIRSSMLTKDLNKIKEEYNTSMTEIIETAVNSFWGIDSFRLGSR